LEVLVAYSEIQREVGSDFPVVLKIVRLPEIVQARGARSGADLRIGGEPQQELGELVVARGRAAARGHRAVEPQRAARIGGLIEGPVAPRYQRAGLEIVGTPGDRDVVGCLPELVQA